MTSTGQQGVSVLSCVPRQHTTFDEKMSWLTNIFKTQRVDLVVTTQEFFGGIVMMPHRKFFTRKELLPPLTHLTRKYNKGLVVGLVETEEDGLNREVIWFIDRGGKYLGKVAKMALPRYDHVTTGGGGQITPELSFDNRFKTFDICGLRASAIFCWEVYSDLLWTGLGLLKPDVIFSLIKFGPNAWPIVKKERGVNLVKGFGYGGWAEEGRWIERLRVASTWQVKCPIISSTNSWNLRPISMPICGCICGIPGQAEDTLWHPRKEDALKSIPEHIQVDTIDPNAVQAALLNKWKYKEVTGQFPPFEIGKFTMMLKINRIEGRILSGRESKGMDLTTKQKKGFGL